MLGFFGLIAVTAMVVTYELERKHPHFIIAFVVSCLAAGAYALLQGAWPFAIAEAFFALSAARRWHRVMGR